jgi:trans-4-hydroxy-L-proline dehydratase
MRNGDARTLMGSLSGVGLQTGDPDAFTHFEQFLDAFLLQADYMIRLSVQASNIRDQLFADHLPAPLISVFIDGCLENRCDITAGGARYNFSGINLINSLANVVDSLHVIKKLVFERRVLTFSRLLAALDDNFQGFQDVEHAIREVPGRWGNADPEVDALAREVAAWLFALPGKYRGGKGGGRFLPFVNSMTSHTMDGRVSMATPDGRKAAMPFAASCNPFNVEKTGVTGVLRSVAALDFRRVMGCAVNIKLHPSAIGRGPEARHKWVALVRTYFKMGGAQLQPTVVSVEMLRAAQRDPDQHRDLIVKVGGYSTYFVHLGREIQEEVIARTEHGVC